jgi:hypothetical protein
MQKLGKQKGTCIAQPSKELMCPPPTRGRSLSELKRPSIHTNNQHNSLCHFCLSINSPNGPK